MRRLCGRRSHKVELFCSQPPQKGVQDSLPAVRGPKVGFLVQRNDNALLPLPFQHREHPNDRWPRPGESVMVMGERFPGGAAWQSQHGDGHLCSLFIRSDKPGVQEGRQNPGKGDRAFWHQRRCFGALTAGFAALAAGRTQLTWRKAPRACQGLVGTWQLQRLFPGWTHVAGAAHGGRCRRLLMEPVWVFSPQAAELVSKNWEAYEAHMRGVRDYLEARLEVSRPGSCWSLPSRGSQAAQCGAWSQGGYVPLALPPPQQDRAAHKPRVVFSPLISPGLLWEAEDPPQQPLYGFQATLQHL